MDETTQAYKNKIGERLTLKIIDALKSKTITTTESSEISAFILENLDMAGTNAQVLEFLEIIAVKWPFLSSLAVAEQSAEIEKDKNNTITEVQNLIQQNKLDEALEVAKASTTQKIGGES
jgi:hypothetical protein